MNIQYPNRPLKILFADDGSQYSLAAIAILCDLPLPWGSSITALGVLIPRETSNYAMLEAALEQSQALLQRTGVKVTTDLQLGYPAEKLIDYASEYEPDLIVMGAKGLRATLGILLGGVAQQIVEYACCPVLVVRVPYKGLQRILLLTDGSEHGQRAVNYLTGQADHEDEKRQPRFPLPATAELRVLHVLPPVPSPELIAQSWSVGPGVLSAMPPVDFEKTEGLLKEEECEGQELLDKTLKMLKAAGWDATGVLLRGDAATEILAYAKENHIDLIVAGSRGLNPVKGWLLGSVSRKLVHYANCSVLIVKKGARMVY